MFLIFSVIHILGIILNVGSLFHPMTDHQLFDDSHFWHMPPADEDSDDPKPMDTFTDLANEGQDGQQGNKVSPE